MNILVLTVSFVLLQAVSAEITFNNYDPRALIDSLPGYGKTWMYFPDGNGIPHITRLHISTTAYKNESEVIEYTTFHLYTRCNKHESQKLQLGNVTNLNASYIDLAKETKFMVHGWLSSEKTRSSQTIKDNFLEAGDYNVILVDWSGIAGNILYPIPMKATEFVGKYLALFIDYLVENGAKLSNIHIIGHSLGAHVSGIAGSFVQKGKINRITGLDPALPGFEFIATNNHRLDPDDASFVDIIHTCAGVLGFYSALGHADFYPNGGTPSQPGCFGLPQLIESCSHGRSWNYFAESIKHDDAFLATECDSWHDFIDGHCANRSIVTMGAALPVTTRGVFFLKTNKKASIATRVLPELLDTTYRNISKNSLGLF